MSQSELTPEQRVKQAMNSTEWYSPYGTGKVQVDNKGTHRIRIPKPLTDRHGINQGDGLEQHYYAPDNLLIIDLDPGD